MSTTLKAMKPNGSTARPASPSNPDPPRDQDAAVLRIASEVPAKDELKSEEPKARASKLAYRKVNEHLKKGGHVFFTLVSIVRHSVAIGGVGFTAFQDKNALFLCCVVATFSITQIWVWYQGESYKQVMEKDTTDSDKDSESVAGDGGGAEGRSRSESVAGDGGGAEGREESLEAHEGIQSRGDARLGHVSWQ
ncbi:hypothetical protein K505DRAFT_343856 [Melanomma pulvis-pyrius CBS 109.77]|uniref:Uncharacterized protein n=1 Tax=Melanomma pulvis-pyrius CBS 109.77 TaxID=1314802 RepID=A0A6A6WQL6_9PLEO|nr:hypothetical protein K505DRAFT_343856 [Melanomma pulvis-pyrius CBS 109.77]